MGGCGAGKYISGSYISSQSLLNHCIGVGWRAVIETIVFLPGKPPLGIAREGGEECALGLIVS